MRPLGGALAVVLAASPARAGLLSAAGVFVQDLSGSPRTQFSNTERINLSAKVSNATASTGRIVFTFRINGPAGSQVFLHTGNSVPGTVGNSASSVSGVYVSKFYTGPGLYTFFADAVLDAQTVTQSATFAVSSPNIILTYPPNGAQNLADQPLTFRWAASGAAQYRVTVCDNISFFSDPSFFQQNTAGTETFLSYPTNPPNNSQRLAAKQVYYWRVEGLDSNGNVIATSNPPFSFTTQAAALTRDLAVTDLDTTGVAAGVVSFTVRVANQGGTTESNVPLRFSLGGLPAQGSPVALPPMSPGDSRAYQFSASLPTDQAQSLAIACLDFFDDNVPNNCKSLQVQRPPDASGGGSGASGFGAGAVVPQEQLWQQVLQKLQQQGMDLSAYNISEMSQQMTAGDLEALLSQLTNGQATVNVSGPGVGGAGGAPSVSVPVVAAPAPPPDTGLPGPAPAAPVADTNMSLPSPDVAAPAPAEPAAPLFTAAPTKEQLWGALGDKLQGQGVDLGGYIVTKAEPPLSAEDAQALVDQLAKGTARISLSGPPPPPPPPPTPAPEPAPPPDAALPPPVIPAPTEPARTETPPTDSSVGREFAGVTTARFGSEGLRTVARDERAFRKLWRRLSSGDAPKLDFKQVMVIVLVAPSGSEATRIEVEDAFATPSGMLVRYSVVGGGAQVALPGAPKREGTPFMVKVVGASTVPVDFQEMAQQGGR